MKYQSFYRFVDLYKEELYLRGEGVFIAYSVFEEWLQQSDKSLEEIYVSGMNTLSCYFTNTNILGLLSLAEQWVLTRGKKHSYKRIYANVRVYNKSYQWLKSYKLK